ncbi:hypothetical protein COV06_04170 [Candidatus Uhrbacteria bacterium CG10_big_fil_rev_8_21_14_0_10_50_16]|uniref:(d)CMP kinase n=1 Tax=Candidatus Uhrbacteria bacterium CG10_big_fil_rev_8_21_14_0_10_50_16 TaxID=1975039 RepID=A0A2H0RMN8_9BACT|nr:MAG: hypothetical protein COV06_04170 [Candidatus Uhrbacteria bacterium CG10_big_fil_rev_8_21_14_0_10_50_16]
MIITLSGYPGSGKSTVGKLLSGKLGYKRYSMGDFQRTLAEQNGMTLNEWNAEEEQEDAHDRMVEGYQTNLGKTEDNFIVDGRLSWYAIPQSFKVFLGVDPAEGAKRIFAHASTGARPNEVPYKNVEEAQELARLRVASENKRFKEYYDVTYDNPANFDLIIDTTHTAPEEVAQQIIDKMGTIA